MMNASSFQDEAARNLRDEIYPRIMKIFNNLIRENAGKSGFIIGDRVSLLLAEN